MLQSLLCPLALANHSARQSGFNCFSASVGCISNSPSHLLLQKTWKSTLSKNSRHTLRPERNPCLPLSINPCHVIKIRIIISAVLVLASAPSDDTLITSLNAISSGALHQFHLPASQTDKGCRLRQSDGAGIQPRRLSSTHTVPPQKRKSTAPHAINSPPCNSSAPPHPPPSPGPTPPYYNNPWDMSPPPTRHFPP